MLGNGAAGFTNAPGSPVSEGLVPFYIRAGESQAYRHQRRWTAEIRWWAR